MSTFRISVTTKPFSELHIDGAGAAEAIKSQMSEFRDAAPYERMEFYLPLESVENFDEEDIVVREAFRNPLTRKGEASLASLHKFVRGMILLEIVYVLMK